MTQQKSFIKPAIYSLNVDPSEVILIIGRLTIEAEQEQTN